MKPVIDSAFGWDEEFQSNGFHSHLQPEWFFWVHMHSEKVGVICKRRRENSVHIHLLIVFSKEQRKGIATAVTQKVINSAVKRNLDVTLSCFKNNKPALNLYTSLGFKVKSDDEYFFDFKKCT